MMPGASALLAGGPDAIFVGATSTDSAYPGTTHALLPAGSMAGDLVVSIAWSYKSGVVSGLLPSGSWSGGLGFVPGEPASYSHARVVRWKLLSSGEVAAGQVDFTGGDNGSGGGGALGGRVELYVVRGASSATSKIHAATTTGISPLGIGAFTPAATSCGAFYQVSGSWGSGNVISNANVDVTKRVETDGAWVHTAMFDVLTVEQLPAATTNFAYSVTAGDKDGFSLEFLR